MAVGITAINSVSIPTLLSCLSLFCMQNATSDLLCPVNAPCSPAPPHLLLLPAAPGPAQAPQMPLFTLQRRCHIPVSSPPMTLCLASEGRHWSSSPVTAFSLSLRAGSMSSCLQGFLIERAGRKTLLWKNYTVMALALGLLTVTLSLQVRPH